MLHKILVWMRSGSNPADIHQFRSHTVKMKKALREIGELLSWNVKVDGQKDTHINRISLLRTKIENFISLLYSTHILRLKQNNKTKKVLLQWCICTKSRVFRQN